MGFNFWGDTNEYYYKWNSSYFWEKNFPSKKNVTTRSIEFTKSRHKWHRRTNKKSSKKQLSFLQTLANNFNRFNFYRNPAEKDNSKLVNEIFSKIKKPNNLHQSICNKFSDSFESLNTIIDWAGSNKKRLKFVLNLNEDLFKYDRPEGNTLIPDLLKSEHAEEYMKQYDKIKYGMGYGVVGDRIK